MSSEQKRLDQADTKEKDWKFWGPYVSERAWGTVREDYSADGSAWEYFPFEHSHLRTYRWNEDGIAGFCDRYQNLCFAPAFWNGKDEILKERFYGVTGNQGNHGEDVKEYYFYLDSTPTHSYSKMLYKYPHEKFPYRQLLEENLKRDKTRPEYELLDTGIFDDDNYFDIYIEYAKEDIADICIKLTVINRAQINGELHILPHVWFRNVWSWDGETEKPLIKISENSAQDLTVFEMKKKDSKDMFLISEGASEFLFCENETNFKKLYNGDNLSGFAKNGINEYIVGGNPAAINPERSGTKAAVHFSFDLAPQEVRTIYLRLTDSAPQKFSSKTFAADCELVIQTKKTEADEFYENVTPKSLNLDAKSVMRQSLAGMLWSKQYFHYVVKDWLDGDPAFPAPPAERLKGRNHEWMHLYNDEIISMPDKWEYPWYAAWDLAFHCIPLAMIDPDFAKQQLILLLREWYMHPNGQIPAYEWKFSDVNPPVHAWAALRVYRIEAKKKGKGDRLFLERIFHKLLLNFTWWVNRKDFEGNNVFEGGFLGLDNIGVFDRSAALPYDGHLEQSDGTSWMAMYSLNMLAIAFELAQEDKAYEDVASKFFEHFVRISDAMNNIGESNTELWSEQDGFYYDVLHFDSQKDIPIKIRSMVGLIPLFVVETIEDKWLDKFPAFKKRTEWFMTHRPDLTEDIACMQREGRERRRLLAIVNSDKLCRILKYVLDESEFLSDFGIRSVSKFHEQSPYKLNLADTEYSVKYEPGESLSGMFGGNSNWRGPVWFPMNYLLIEALQKFDYYYGEEFKIEFPTGSGNEMNLWQVSQELEKRLCRIFLKDENGRRASNGNNEKFQSDENWRDNVLFYEYFHGDSGCGLGANHQTGWTGLIAKLLQQLGEYTIEDKEKI